MAIMRKLTLTQAGYAILCECSNAKWDYKPDANGNVTVDVESGTYDRLIEETRAMGTASPSDTLVRMYRETRFPAPPPQTGADDQC